MQVISERPDDLMIIVVGKKTKGGSDQAFQDEEGVPMNNHSLG